MPQIWSMGPFMARTMIEDGHGVKVMLHCRRSATPTAKRREGLWIWCDEAPIALRQSPQLTKA